MSLSFPRLIASRYLWSKRKEAFITLITIISVLGVAIGVMVIDVTMAIMTGFESELRNKIVNADSHIMIKRLGGYISEWEPLVDTIKDLPGVESVAGFTHNQALLKSDAGSAGILIRGVQPGSASEKLLLAALEPARTDNPLLNPPVHIVPCEEGVNNECEVKLPGIIVGKELLRNFGVLIGTPVALLSPQVGSTPLGLVPKFKRFMLTAAYSTGLTQYESGLAYMLLSDAQRFFNLDDRVSGIEVRVKDLDAAPRIASEIMQKIGGFSSGFYTQDWTQTNKPLWDAIKLEKRVYFLVLLLIIVMASFSIVSTLVLLVMEKRADIAILRTMGAKTKVVGNIFRMQGAIIGLLGTIAGTVLGYLGCIALRRYGFPLDERIFQIAEVPVRMEPLNFALVAIAAFTICFIATIYPARRASALQPSEVLRYQ